MFNGRHNNCNENLFKKKRQRYANISIKVISVLNYKDIYIINMHYDLQSWCIIEQDFYILRRYNAL